MPSRSPNRAAATSSALFRAVAVLCLLLVLLASMAHGVHTHADHGEADPACSLCVVAHLTAAPAPVVGPPVQVATVIRIRPPDAQPIRYERLPLHLQVRPPPAGTTHA